MDRIDDGGDVAAIPVPRSSHGWLWWAFYVLGWAVALSLAATALLRVFYHDGAIFLCWFNAFTPYVYLPAYACLAWAAWQRRWGLAVVAMAVVVGHLFWMAPTFQRDRRFDAPANTQSASLEATPDIRVIFANVLGNHRDYDPLWKEISEEDPDVVVLAECTYYCRQSFRQSPLMKAYVEANPKSQSQLGEVVVFSKLPIKTEVVNWSAGRIVRTIEVPIGSQFLRLVALHAPRPMYSPNYDYYGYWSQMVPFLTAMRGPRLIIGDFNATSHSLVYKQLRKSGLRAAHDDRGRGLATTWPNGRLLLPPIRIDHAFLSPEIECISVREGRGGGSDHKPVIVDLKMRESPLAASTAGTVPRQVSDGSSR